MNVKACAPADKATSWETIDWIAAKGYVRKLQMRIVKAVKQGQSFRLMINNCFDEDLYQNLAHVFLKCINSFLA